MYVLTFVFKVCCPNSRDQRVSQQQILRHSWKTYKNISILAKDELQEPLLCSSGCCSAGKQDDWFLHMCKALIYFSACWWLSPCPFSSTRAPVPWGHISTGCQDPSQPGQGSGFPRDQAAGSGEAPAIPPGLVATGQQQGSQEILGFGIA